MNLLNTSNLITGRKRTKRSTTSSSKSSNASMILTLGMQRIVEKLKTQRHCGTTRANYYNIWKSFNRFFLRLDTKPDNWEDRIIWFIAHLVDTKKQSSTVKSYISAIRAVLQEDSYELSENDFLVSALTKACKLNNDEYRTRLPIHKGLLNILLDQVEKLYDSQPYPELLYKTIFLLHIMVFLELVS